MLQVSLEAVETSLWGSALGVDIKGGQERHQSTEPGEQQPGPQIDLSDVKCRQSDLLVSPTQEEKHQGSSPLT